MSSCLSDRRETGWYRTVRRRSSSETNGQLPAVCYTCVSVIDSSKMTSNNSLDEAAKNFPAAWDAIKAASGRHKDGLSLWGRSGHRLLSAPSYVTCLRRWLACVLNGGDQVNGTGARLVFACFLFTIVAFVTRQPDSVSVNGNSGASYRD